MAMVDCGYLVKQVNQTRLVCLSSELKEVKPRILPVVVVSLGGEVKHKHMY